MNNIICDCEKPEKVYKPSNIYPINFKYQDKIDFNSKENNSIRTTKYRWYNFIVLNLGEQFKRFSNIFFILCVVLNFIPNVSVFSKETSVIPISFVLITTMIKDGYEDLKRWISDRQVNGKLVQLYDKTSNNFITAKWCDVKLGDFVKVSCDERIPADLLLYYTSDKETGFCYIETSDIDGETNLKQRQLIKPDKKSKLNLNNPLSSAESTLSNYYFEVDGPNREIYNFNGKMFDADNDNFLGRVTNSNLLLRDTLLRNTEEIRGIVVYSGQKTKVMMNNIKPRFKRSLLEEQINMDNMWCLGILIIICFISAVGHTLWLNQYSNPENVVFLLFDISMKEDPALQGFLIFWTSVIIYQSIIPLPLYVTLEFVKAHQILHMSSDKNLYNAEIDKKIEIRAFNITEDLGQINHIFCDKTGTLTENNMTFRKAFVNNKIYDCDDSLILKESKSKQKNSDLHEFLLALSICHTAIITKDARKEKKLVDISADLNDNKSIASTMNNSAYESPAQLYFSELFNITEIKPLEPIEPVTLEQVNPIPRDIINPTILEVEGSVKSSTNQKSLSSMTLNNNHLRRSKLMNLETIFSLILSESPDEEALIKLAFVNGYKFINRSSKSIFIAYEEKDQTIEYEIIKVLEFDSDRKCMSIIVSNGSEIIIYCKGADSAMIDKIDKSVPKNLENLNKLQEAVNEFALKGLRTLVVAMKKLTAEQFKLWNREYKNIMINFGDDPQKIRELYDKIESNLDLLGATGIEDNLQDKVPEVLECLKEAGINIWILTGDKQETAVNIAYSTNLFHREDKLLYVNGNNYEDIQEILKKHQSTIDDSLKSNSITKSDSNVSSDKKEEPCSHVEYGLVIDSTSLDFVLKDQSLSELFLHVAYFCNSAVCCRCTPIQKSKVVSLVKQYFSFRTMAVGDGANDVNMIRTADIGVGIGGKEGRQATMASDFAITQFKDLKRLILVHGHWNYDKLARMSLYIFYKCIFYSIVLFLYQSLCGFSGATAVDQITQLLFHLVPTGLPPLIFGIWEKDFDDRVLLANPQIYKTGIHSKMYRRRDFWRNITDAIYQSIAIFVIVFLSYKDSDVDMSEIGIITISAVIFTMFGHYIIISKHWSVLHWFSIIGCLLVGFYMPLLIFNSICVVHSDCRTDNPYKNLHHTMAQPKTYLVIALSCAASLFPRLFWTGTLFSSRDSISYEAQRRLNIKKIPRSIWNVRKLRNDKELDLNGYYEYQHKIQIDKEFGCPYYLGNLESHKKIECRKCHRLNQLKTSYKTSENIFLNNEKSTKLFFNKLNKRNKIEVMT